MMMNKEPCCIASIDKDFFQIEGKHYNFVTQQFREVSKLEAIHNFYFQLVMGDRADNIFGFDGKARNKVPKFLEETVAILYSFTDEYDMYDFVRELYNDDVRLHMNAKCLWLLREEGEHWQPPVKPTMEVTGPKDDTIPS